MGGSGTDLKIDWIELLLFSISAAAILPVAGPCEEKMRNHLAWICQMQF